MELKGISVFDNKPVLVRIDPKSPGGSCDGTKISEVTELSSASQLAEAAQLPFISPGFLDLQVNGFNGIDYSLDDLTAEQIEDLVIRLAASGTTGHAATFVTMPNGRLLRNLALAAETMEKNALVRAGIAGFHIEGTFISPEDGPRGAHDKKYTREPDFSLFEEWQRAARGQIKMITLAPELPGALDFIRAAVKSGVRVSLGHTAASPEQIREAIAAGAVCSTHLGNGSHPQLPRLKNYIWEQMAADSLWAGIICDGFHLPGPVVKVISRAKGTDRLFMVSDAALPGGYKPGFYKWGNLDVEVFDDGHLGIAGSTGALAGAAHLLDWDIARYMEFTGASLKEAVALCTIRPARFLGLSGSAGSDEYSAIAAGNPANLTTFFYKPGDRQLRIQKTIINGQCIAGTAA
jgi:N-acetylglucosamine-6-phosphate deacetylase